MAPHRKFRTPKVLDEMITLRNGYPKSIRQLCIRDLGHEKPTILLTNDTRSTPRTLIERYARRMLTPATVDISHDAVEVRLPRRAHNPLLIESGLFHNPVAVPWWGGASLEVIFP
jgi:hypothetical protein